MKTFEDVTGEPEDCRPLPWQMMEHSDPEVRKLAAMALSREAALRGLLHTQERTVLVVALYRSSETDDSVMLTGPSFTHEELEELAVKAVVGLNRLYMEGLTVEDLEGGGS